MLPQTMLGAMFFNMIASWVVEVMAMSPMAVRDGQETSNGTTFVADRPYFGL